MPLGTWIAGRYSATYQAPADSARSLGITERGWTLGTRLLKQVIDQTDAYARTPLDGIYQGARCSVSGVFKEVLAGTYKALYGAYNTLAPTGASSFNLGTVGKLDSDNAGILILTATAGTPAASTPATLTATLAMLAEDFDVEKLFGPEHRLYPFRFTIYPYDASGTIKLFTTT